MPQRRVFQRVSAVDLMARVHACVCVCVWWRLVRPDQYFHHYRRAYMGVKMARCGVQIDRAIRPTCRCWPQCATLRSVCFSLSAAKDLHARRPTRRCHHTCEWHTHSETCAVQMTVISDDECLVEILYLRIHDLGLITLWKRTACWCYFQSRISV